MKQKSTNVPHLKHIWLSWAAFHPLEINESWCRDQSYSVYRPAQGELIQMQASCAWPGPASHARRLRPTLHLAQSAMQGSYHQPCVSPGLLQEEEYDKAPNTHAKQCTPTLHLRDNSTRMVRPNDITSHETIYYVTFQPKMDGLSVHPEMWTVCRMPTLRPLRQYILLTIRPSDNSSALDFT